jgi:hypothetical protein
MVVIHEQDILEENKSLLIWNTRWENRQYC